MPEQRGVARRTSPRRRTWRTIIKSGYPVYVRRFKKLIFSPQGKGKFFDDPPPTEELDWELDVLDELEQRTYAELDYFGVPSDQWQWYMGFQKRLWERRVHFDQATFQLEKLSLVTEYTLRGWDPLILAALQDIAEELAEAKITGVIPPLAPTPAAWAYFNAVGKINLTEWGGYFSRGSGTGAIFVDAPPSQQGGYYKRLP